MSDTGRDMVHLARLIGEGKTSDVHGLTRRILRQLVKDRPDLAAGVHAALEGMAHPHVVRKAESASALPIPIDEDSRLELVRSERPDTPDVMPRWPRGVEEVLDTVVRERGLVPRLLAEGLTPTRSLLFVGPPGVGKTLAARELARRIDRPLLTLDLAAVMSSFLGRTGNNIRTVLDFAAGKECVLLLDEFDAIAKRRDDTAELGELKRLVNVLLQAIDGWPSHSVLIAATNHPELLDPAVWRRFDVVVEFPLPALEEVRAAVRAAVGVAVSDDLVDLLAASLQGRPYSDIGRTVNVARREAITKDQPLEDALVNRIGDLMGQLSAGDRLRIAKRLEGAGYSQRRIQSLTGVSRETLRKYRGKEA